MILKAVTHKEQCFCYWNSKHRVYQNECVLLWLSFLYRNLYDLTLRWSEATPGVKHSTLPEYLSQSILYLSPFCCLLRNSMLKLVATEIHSAIISLIYSINQSLYYLSWCRCLNKTTIRIKISSRLKLGVRLIKNLKIFQVSFLPLTDTYFLSSRERDLGQPVDIKIFWRLGIA